MSCSECFIYVQFPGVQTSDVAISINGGQYPNGWSVADLVDNNPQFFFEYGVNGVSTLCTHIIMRDVDTILTCTRGMESIESIAQPFDFVGGRPGGRYGGSR